MAKIAFFTEAISPEQNDLSAHFSWQIVKALTQQGHQVLVLTAQRQNLDHLALRCEITQPFYNFYWYEGLAVLPMLANFQPDILHFTQSSVRASRIFSHIGSLHSLVARPLIMTSLFDLTHDWRSKLIECSDVITCFNTLQLSHLANEEIKKVEVLPLTVPKFVALAPSWQPFEHWLYVPDTDPEHFLAVILPFLQLADESWGVVVGSWGDIGLARRRQILHDLYLADCAARVYWAESDELKWLGRASVVSLATLPSQGLAFEVHLQHAANLAKPVLLTDEQHTWTSLPNESLAFVTLHLRPNEIRHTWIKFFNDSPETEPAETIQASSDESGNRLSRLYVAGLELKRIHT